MAYSLTVQDDGPAIVLTHDEMGTATTGTSYDLSRHRIASIDVQAFGTFGGATLTVQGSMDGSNWSALQIVDGSTAASLTAAGVLSVLQLPLYIRAVTSGGTGSDIDAIIVIRKG